MFNVRMQCLIEDDSATFLIISEFKTLFSCAVFSGNVNLTISILKWQILMNFFDFGMAAKFASL